MSLNIINVTLNLGKLNVFSVKFWEKMEYMKEYYYYDCMVVTRYCFYNDIQEGNKVFECLVNRNE